MRILPATVISGLLCLFCVSAAVAQRSEPPKNPQEIEIWLRLAEAHSYRAGELIRAQIRFPGRSLAPAQQPPQESWQFAGLLLDPAGNCGSLAAPCFPPMALGFDKSDPILRLGNTSDPVAVSLNNYLPVLRPARYRTAVLARKLVLTNRNHVNHLRVR